MKQMLLLCFLGSSIAVMAFEPVFANIKHQKKTTKQKKFTKDDFQKKFGVRYLNKIVVKAEQVFLCDSFNDTLYKESESFYQDLMKKYGSKLDVSYLPKLYVAFVDDKVGHGLFAGENIKKGDMIGEYTGELVMVDAVSDDPRYLFSYPSVYKDEHGAEHQFFIDAEKSGNYTRFANHAEHVNAITYNIPHKGLWKVVFVANEDIAQGQQIFIDYGVDYWKARSKPLEMNV